MLEPGDTAPKIVARNQRGEQVEPGFEEPTVVYFYPKDDTPGCTVEANQFEAERETYQDAGVAVYGVSMDDVDSHRAFAEKFDLEFDLLADPDGGIASAFDLDVSNSGKTGRHTFVLAAGEVYRVYESVDPDGHPRKILEGLLDDGIVELDS